MNVVGRVVLPVLHSLDWDKMQVLLHICFVTLLLSYVSSSISRKVKSYMYFA